jgi:cell division protein FtsZ
MVFITAGMGGGTGTGAAPVIAKIAKEMDILTVGIVTAPFSFEGKKKFSAAQTGIAELKESCDTVLVILNDKLREIYGNLSIGNAFGQADNILTTAAKGIAEIITVAGYVNVDFQDVRTVMHNAGAAVMGSSQTKGENRARRAAEEALSSPLLDNRDIMGAQKILLSIISGEQAELQMDELTEITEYIQEEAGDDAEVIFGHGVDQELEDYIRVTVIATGFDHELTGNAARAPRNERKIMDLEAPVERQVTIFDDNPSDSGEIELRKRDESADQKQDEEEQRSYSFDFKNRETDHQEHEFSDDEGEDDLFSAVDTDMEMTEFSDDEDFFNNNGMPDVNQTRKRLEEQAQQRIERLKATGRVEMRPDEFKERLDVPAYLRKEVRFQSVPSSSESQVSKYNLNDDNNILGNNRFLHDNVD